MVRLVRPVRWATASMRRAPQGTGSRAAMGTVAVYVNVKVGRGAAVAPGRRGNLRRAAGVDLRAETEPDDPALTPGGIPAIVPQRPRVAVTPHQGASPFSSPRPHGDAAVAPP